MRFNKEEAPDYVEGKDDYTDREKELMADELLREDARSEICKDCGKRGEESGHVEIINQPLEDEEGTQLVLEFKELVCENDHKWFEGEGDARGIGGDSPILFEDHLASRKRREIYTSVGTPDPNIVQGIYNRVHKDGRKMNSEEQRKRHGASFYK